MNKELAKAFEQAIYQIDQPLMRLLIGIPNPEFMEFLRKKESSCWAILTAVNPRSVILEESENKRRMEELRKELTHYTVYPGRALDPSGEWPPEENLLILDIDREEATFLGKKWEQNAILFGGNDGRGKLIWL